MSDNFCMEFIDMHIHLDSYNTIDNNTLYIHNSMDRESFLHTKKQFGGRENVIISFGIHPMEAYKSTIKKREVYSLIEDSPFIGEIGLDFHWIEDKSTYSKQLEVFNMMLEVCKECGKIPMIHTKGAEKEVLQQLKEYKIHKSLIHWYSGPENLIDEYLETGSYFTVGPDVCIDKSIYRYIPYNRLFLETDNPTGVPWIIDEKREIDYIYNCFSNLSGLELKQLKTQLWENYTTLIST